MTQLSPMRAFLSMMAFSMRVLCADADAGLACRFVLQDGGHAIRNSRCPAEWSRLSSAACADDAAQADDAVADGGVVDNAAVGNDGVIDLARR